LHTCLVVVTAGGGWQFIESEHTFFVVVTVNVGVIRVVSGDCEPLRFAELLDFPAMIEVLEDDGGMERELERGRLLLLLLLLVGWEEELREFVAGTTGKSLDGEDVEEVDVVLRSGELLEEEVKLEEVSVVLNSDELLEEVVKLEDKVEL
jgi:hypothetical protein